LLALVSTVTVARGGSRTLLLHAARQDARAKRACCAPVPRVIIIACVLVSLMILESRAKPAIATAAVVSTRLVSPPHIRHELQAKFLLHFRITLHPPNRIFLEQHGCCVWCFFGLMVVFVSFAIKDGARYKYIDASTLKLASAGRVCTTYSKWYTSLGRSCTVGLHLGKEFKGLANKTTYRLRAAFSASLHSACFLLPFVAIPWMAHSCIACLVSLTAQSK
jgi:hypothetical protein